MRKQYITFAGTCACFSMPSFHRFHFSCPDLMTGARIPTLNYGFFSKKRDRLVVTLKTPDKECPVRSFTSAAQAIGMQRQSITGYSEVCFVTTQ